MYNKKAAWISGVFMDIKTISTYRTLEQLAIRESKKSAFSSDSINRKKDENTLVQTVTKSKRQSTKTKGLDYYA